MIVLPVSRSLLATNGQHLFVMASSSLNSRLSLSLSSSSNLSPTLEVELKVRPKLIQNELNTAAGQTTPLAELVGRNQIRASPSVALSGGITRNIRPTLSFSSLLEPARLPPLPVLFRAFPANDRFVERCQR